MKKKAYKKPKVRKVNLKADESVMTACKGPGNQGPQHGNCAMGAVACHERGS